MTSPNLKNGDGDGRENIFVVDFGDFVSARRRSHSEAVCWGVGACGSSVFFDRCALQAQCVWSLGRCTCQGLYIRSVGTMPDEPGLCMPEGHKFLHVVCF